MRLRLLLLVKVEPRTMGEPRTEVCSDASKMQGLLEDGREREDKDHLRSSRLPSLTWAVLRRRRPITRFEIVFKLCWWLLIYVVTIVLRGTKRYIEVYDSTSSFSDVHLKSSMRYGGNSYTATRTAHSIHTTQNQPHRHSTSTSRR